MIDDLDELFAYGDVATDVLGMLRAWYEQGRSGAGQNLWPQLRLAIAHSTETWYRSTFTSRRLMWGYL